MRTAFTVEQRPFETDFWSKQVVRLDLHSGATPSELSAGLDELLKSGDDAIIEANLDLSDIGLGNVLTDHGFRLVDSRITFVSRVAAGDPEFAYQSDHPDFKFPRKR